MRERKNPRKRNNTAQPSHGPLLRFRIKVAPRSAPAKEPKIVEEPAPTKEPDNAKEPASNDARVEEIWEKDKRAIMDKHDHEKMLRDWKVGAKTAKADGAKEF